MKSICQPVIRSLPLYLWVITLATLLTSCDQEPHAKIDSKLNAQWVRIPGGSYLMGNTQVTKNSYDERPQHVENIGTLDVMKTEATAQQYAQCVKDNICEIPYINDSYCTYGKKNKLNHPINCINWHQANTFCAYTNGRLPFEAEWEYIARSGGKQQKYPWGDEPSNCKRSNSSTSNNSKQCTDDVILEVCSLPEGNSDQGLCDLSGNVIEWINDWYFPNYNYSIHKEIPVIRNYLTAEVTPNKLMRGGGVGTAEDDRASNRIYHGGEFAYPGLGVRCVRDVDSNRPKTKYEQHMQTVTAVAKDETKRIKGNPYFSRLIHSSEISTQSRVGDPVNADGVIEFNWDGLAINFDKSYRASAIEASMGSNDRFLLRFYMKASLLGIAEFFPLKYHSDKLIRQHSKFAGHMKNVPFDRVVIIPVKGDGKFQLGHFRIIE